MPRRWIIALTTVFLASGAVVGMAGTASAAMGRFAPVSQVRAGPQATGFRPGGLMIRPTEVRHPRGRAGVDTIAYSTNWSGYAVTGASGGYTSVSASWTEPTALCAGNRKRAHQYSSFWAGLDGFNSSSVEQTGTDADCSGTTPRYYGWYEMYPAFPVNFSNTVRPGDAMSASVTFSGTDTFTLVLTDATQGWTRTITQHQAGLARSSAEVITEAPSSSSGVLPLADFGTVTYSASTGNGASLGMQNPTEIIMVDNSNNQKDTTSPINSTSGGFFNTWLRST